MRAIRTKRASSRWLRGAVGWLACALLSGGLAHADEAATAVYYRTDTDQTMVVSPRMRVAKEVGDATRVEGVYMVDVWTSASIDIRTSASVVPVTEQRDEIDGNVSHELGDLTLTGNYRFSTENDYDSHTGTAGASLDLASNSTTLASSLSLGHDQVGRAGDPSFQRRLTTLSAKASYTQVLDPDTLAQLTYQLTHMDGYQASPYRFVGIGGTGLGCIGATFCLPERFPQVRNRHAVALLARHALSSSVSVGGVYRFYIDDWGLLSNTLQGRLGWWIDDASMLTLRYRFYIQGAADFYEKRYTDLQRANDFLARDRELSSMSSHRLGVGLDRRWELDAGYALRTGLSTGATIYSYPDFVGLDGVTAFELSAALVLER